MYDPKKPYTKEILDLIKQTWETPYVSVKDFLIEKKFLHKEFQHVDGIGTKGIFHWQRKSFEYAVQDALRMNLNDLAFGRATPFAITDHIFTPTDDYFSEIVKHLVKECKEANIAIVGGEPAVHSNIRGMDISIAMSGFIEKPTPNAFRQKDALIGIESSGLHSNGFTKINELFADELESSDLPRKEFIEPTNNYLPTILSLNKKYDIHGMMHITGGAFTKLKGLLNDCEAYISAAHSLKPQEIFYEIYKRKVPDKVMYETFNCGIGFILGVDYEDLEDCLKDIKDFKADIIGKVFEGKGKVKISSRFSKKEVTF